MNTGTKELKSILEELDELKLPHMAAELETLYKQPDFVNNASISHRISSRRFRRWILCGTA